MLGCHSQALKNIVHVLLIAALAVTLGACSTVNYLQGEEDPAKLAGAYYKRALGFMQTKQYPQAITDLQRAIMADPDIYQAYYQLGLAYKAQGRVKHAMQAWSAGLSKAQRAEEREDYSRPRAIAEFRAALATTVLKAKAARRAVAAQAAMLPAKAPAPPAMAKYSGMWAVLYSSNLKRSSAAGDVVKLGKRGIKAMVKPHASGGVTWYRVWVGCCTSYTVARKRARQLNALGVTQGAAAMKPGI